MSGIIHMPRGGVRPSGRFQLTSRGWNGKLLGHRAFDNGTTDEGVTYLAAATFLRAAQRANWYVGLIDNAGFSQLLTTDTHQSHPGFAEYAGVYLGQRVAWAPAAASSRLLDAPNTVVSITASGSVRGALLASTPTIGTASGQVLYATGADTDALAVEAGGTVIVAYKLRLTPRT